LTKVFRQKENLSTAPILFGGGSCSLPRASPLCHDASRLECSKCFKCWE